MKKKILLIGVGNIGYRHLQSLANLKVDEIDCLEKNKIKKKKFQKIFIKNKNINFLNSIDNLKKKYDIAIDATTSISRFRILSIIIKKTKIRKLLIEKFLFQNYSQYYKFEKMIKTNKIKTFVNCPMRTYKAFSFIKKRIHKKIFLVKITGSNWNMCSNSIHYLDLFNYFDNNFYKYTAVSFLKKKIKKSKRKPFIEFDGKIYIGSQKNHLLLEHNKKFKYNEKIEIFSKNFKFEVLFIKKKVSIILKYTNKKIERFNFPLPFQSEETQKFVENKMREPLLNYNISSKLHILLLSEFMNNYKKIKKSNKIINCPIT